VDTCFAALSQFLDLDTPVAAAVVAAVVAAMKEDMEQVAVVVAVAVANVAKDKEGAVAATLGEGVQVAAHCVASVVGPAGGRDSLVDACEAATHVDGDVCDRPFDFFVLFLSCYLCSVPSKYIPQQRARVRRG
jgi:hypothetical protein